jgi:DNA-binding response OmpR family regulator
MTGLEFCRRVRSDRNDVSLIIATGTFGSLLAADLSWVRFSAILRKPFSLIDLVDAVRRVRWTNWYDHFSGAHESPAIRSGDTFPGQAPTRQYFRGVHG